MIRPSKHYAIVKKDLDDGLVKKKEYEGMVEYWAYRRKESSIVSPGGGNFVTDDLFLYAVIICPREHVTLDTEKYYEIEGVKFTNDFAGQDLDDYLNKTKRGYLG